MKVKGEMEKWKRLHSFLSATFFDFASVLGRVQGLRPRFARRLRRPGHGLRALAVGQVRSRFAGRQGENNMALQVARISIEVVGALRPLVLRIRRYDRSLADQVVRAANSVALNIAEGEHSDPGNRRARFYSAAGSANETLAALKVVVAWGYFAAPEAEKAVEQLRSVLGMLWKLTRG